VLGSNMNRYVNTGLSISYALPLPDTRLDLYGYMFLV